MQKFFKQKNSGFTLVETLVAISIFTMSILALLSVLASGISDTGYAKQKMKASYLAQEGIECIRNVRDNYVLYTAVTGLGWKDFVALDPNTDITCPFVNDSNFRRSLSIVDIGSDDEVKILSMVDWDQGSGTYSITFSENLFNWIE